MRVWLVPIVPSSGLPFVKTQLISFCISLMFWRAPWRVGIPRRPVFLLNQHLLPATPRHLFISIVHEFSGVFTACATILCELDMHFQVRIDFRRASCFKCFGNLRNAIKLKESRVLTKTDSNFLQGVNVDQLPPWNPQNYIDP